MIDESDLDILELEEEGRDSDAFSVGRLITVALGGAVVSLGAPGGGQRRAGASGLGE